jgi:N-methylhydantoinase B
VLLRATSVHEDFAAGRIPALLSELGGEADVIPSHHETDLGSADVYFTHWQGGGGYGDPLLREPGAVAADVIAHKVSVTGAHDVYGVVLASDGTVDQDATTFQRSALRLSRAGLGSDGQELNA